VSRSLLVLAMSAFLAGCSECGGQSAHDESMLEADVAALVPRTVGRRGIVGGATTPQRFAHRIEMTWTVTTDEDWESYRASVEQALRPEFSLADSSSARLLFTRTTRGDAYLVELRRQTATDGGASSVSIVFVARPS
jgi:hypothetical protein